MFDFVNINIGGGRNWYRRARNKVKPYATGDPIEKPKMKILLVDQTGETEIDKAYLNYLTSENGVLYDGMIEDTYGVQVYRYYLK